MSKLLNAGQSPFGWHRLQSFMQCPTKYYKSYIAKVPRDFNVPALIVGSLVHTALAHRYTLMGELDMDVLSPVDAIKEQAQLEGKEWLEWVEKAIDTYLAYIEDPEVVKFESEIEILSVEEVYQVNFTPENRLTFRADLMVRWNDKIYFVDHKTCAFLKKDQTDGYAVSGQFLTYILYGRVNFREDFGGMLVNYLAHGGQRSEKKAFKREVVPVSEPHLGRFGNSVLFYLNQIKTLDGTAEYFYPRIQSEFTCVHKYGKCPHYDSCFNSSTTINSNGEQNND